MGAHGNARPRRPGRVCGKVRLGWSGKRGGRRGQMDFRHALEYGEPTGGRHLPFSFSTQCRSPVEESQLPDITPTQACKLVTLKVMEYYPLFLPSIPMAHQQNMERVFSNTDTDL